MVTTAVIEPKDGRRSKRADVRISRATREKMAWWSEHPIACVAHASFRRPGAAARLGKIRPEAFPSEMGVESPEVADSWLLPRFARHDLLSDSEEKALFYWMNFLKWRAERTRKALPRSGHPARDIAAIQRDLAEAVEARNLLVEKNLRLVVALANKLAPAPQAMPELVSDALPPLIRAVELFDVSLGNRFSTYATWAARNQMIRTLQRMRGNQAVTAASDEIWERLADHRATDLSSDPVLNHRTEFVEALLAQLSERERTIVAARFGLGGHAAGQSLTDIAGQVGLSKERVRQIFLESLDKLKGWARTRPDSCSDWDLAGSTEMTS